MNDEMNDHDDDAVLSYFFYYNFIMHVWSCYYDCHVLCFSLFESYCKILKLRSRQLAITPSKAFFQKQKEVWN